jgi:hypothetical protein
MRLKKRPGGISPSRRQLADKRLGLLINFNVPLIKDGIPAWPMGSRIISRKAIKATKTVSPFL